MAVRTIGTRPRFDLAQAAVGGTATTMIAILDYGAGNLRSVLKGLQATGAMCRVTSDPADVARARALVIPGVAAAADTMSGLRARGLVEPALEALRDGKPFLGICMGLQALMTFSEEGDGEACMDVLHGSVLKLPHSVKVPHMGWNQVVQRRSGAWLLDGIPDGANFYFVHSFYAQPQDEATILADTDYGVRMPSVVVRDHIAATQFHPEKSGRWGLRLLENFARFAGER